MYRSPLTLWYIFHGHKCRKLLPSLTLHSHFTVITSAALLHGGETSARGLTISACKLCNWIRPTWPVAKILAFHWSLCMRSICTAQWAPFSQKVTKIRNTFRSHLLSAKESRKCYTGETYIQVQVASYKLQRVQERGQGKIPASQDPLYWPHTRTCVKLVDSVLCVWMRDPSPYNWPTSVKQHKNENVVPKPYRMTNQIILALRLLFPQWLNNCITLLFTFHVKIEFRGDLKRNLSSLRFWISACLAYLFCGI